VSEHIVPRTVYVAVFTALLAGTGLTVAAAYVNMGGGFNVVVALTIAVTKATLVVLYFMHVRYSSRLTWVVVVSGVFWLAILFAFTFADYLTRPVIQPSARPGTIERAR
jgi:cytochrome c oxidase subunit 4